MDYTGLVVLVVGIKEVLPIHTKDKMTEIVVVVVIAVSW